MCLPALPALAAVLPSAGTMSAIGSGLSILSSVAGVATQQQAANDQAEANRRQAEQIMRNYAANNAQVNLEQQQEREAVSQKINANNANARAAQSTARVAAGEGGVSGLSVDALLADYGMKQDNYNKSVMTNYERASTALDNQRQNIYASAASSINGLKTPPAPDYIGGGLRIATELSKYAK